MVTHLSTDAGFRGHFCQESSFVDGACQRLLRVATNTQSHGFQRNWSVHVIGCADGDDVNFLSVLCEQFAIVGEFLCTLESWRIAFAIQGISVDVTNRDDIAELRSVARVATSFAPDANAGNVELLIRSLAECRSAACGNEVSGANDRSILNKLTAICSRHWFFPSLEVNKGKQIGRFSIMARLEPSNNISNYRQRDGHWRILRGEFYPLVFLRFGVVILREV